MTPFHKAAGAESLDIVKYIEEQGAKTNALTGDGCTSLPKKAGIGLRLPVSGERWESYGWYKVQVS